MSAPGNRQEHTAEEREAPEARFTNNRIVELAADPVRGNFDAAHLKQEDTKRRVVYSMDQLANNPRLADLPRDAIRPRRAVAFDSSPSTKRCNSIPSLPSPTRLCVSQRKL